MAREIELKLALDPASEAALRGAKVLAAAAPSRHRLLALYFDTPDGELRAGGMALRLRRGDRRWVQTLKAADANAAAGLHDRSEWERARPGPSLDLALFADTPLAKLDDPATLHERLREIFRIDSVRTSWIVKPSPDTRVEVVLDRGRVEALGRTQAICEVEVECLEGEPSAIFDVAASLLDEVDLRPSSLSKAERGYRLRSRSRLQPMKAPKVRLEKGATHGDAARTAIGSSLRQFQANAEGLATGSDPEFVHQARVALRALRAALRTFRAAVGEERSQAWRRTLGGTARALGSARDWDVFAGDALPEVLHAFGDAELARVLVRRAGARRRKERDAARAALGLRAHARVLLELERWLAIPQAESASSPPLADFAARRIRKAHRRLLADGAGVASLGTTERHQLRIDVKKLRYGVDALATLFPRKRVERYVGTLKALQDALGQANDGVTAGRLLPELDPPEPFATFARGWFAARGNADGALLEDLLESLAAAPRFWRRKGKVVT